VTAESAVEAKRELPESQSQVKEFDRRRRAYREAGLCHACAAQAAFGHQMGFLQVHPPCSSCVPVVMGFPYPAENSWRRFRRGRSLTEVATWPMPLADSGGARDSNGHLTSRQTAA
jgi:hypothetical protein